MARMAEGRRVHRVLVGKPEGKRPLGRPRRRWEDNIKMDLQEVGGGCGYWMELAQDRDRWWALVNTVHLYAVQLTSPHRTPYIHTKRMLPHCHNGPFIFF